MKNYSLVSGVKIIVQTKSEDVNRILDEVCKIDKLTYGEYDRNYFLSHISTAGYTPRKGSTSDVHLGTTDPQKIDSIELSFVCKKENLDRILETIINEHHYEQPNIQVQDVLTTRTSYDVNNKNPNRFWNKK